jgi:hypothetical protein
MNGYGGLQYIYGYSPRCKTCAGTGSVTNEHGIKVRIKVLCEDCQGTGLTPVEGYRPAWYVAVLLVIGVLIALAFVWYGAGTQ